MVTSNAVADCRPQAFEARRMRLRLDRVCCTEAWADACMDHVNAGTIKPPGHQCRGKIERALARSGFYPPGPGRFDRSKVSRPMCSCMSRSCGAVPRGRSSPATPGRLYPAYYTHWITTRHGSRMRLCTDCAMRWDGLLLRRERGRGEERKKDDVGREDRSQATAALDRLRSRGETLPALALATEDDRTLRQQLAAFSQGKPSGLDPDGSLRRQHERMLSIAGPQRTTINVDFGGK